MRELFYAGGSAIISDQTCKAVLRYARALARANTSDIVVFPALTDKHRKGYAHFLIGPASQPHDGSIYFSRLGSLPRLPD